MSPLARRFKFPFNRSLRQQIMSLVGGMLLLVLVVIGAGVAYFTYRTEVAAWRGRQSEAARSAAQTVAAFVQNTRQTLYLISVIAPAELDHNPIDLATFLQRSPALQEAIRLDATGRILIGAHRDQPVLANLITIAQSEWFLQAKAGQTYLGNVQLSFNNEPYLIMAVPTPDGGAVAARVRMDILWAVVADIHFGETGRTYVVNQRGQIIAHTDRDFVLSNTNLADRPEYQGLSSTSDADWYGEYISFQGDRVVGTAAKVPDTNWIVIAELPQQEAYATSRTAFLWLMGGLLMFAILTSLITRWLLNRWVIRPVEQLRAGVERIGQGDLAYRIGLTRDDEIGQVSGAFDRMTERLRDREEQLRQLNVELEDRVAERTTELQQANTRQAALLAAGQAVSSSLDLQAVLNHLAEQLVQALDLTSSYICDWQPDTGTAALLAVSMGAAVTPRERATDELGTIYHLIEDFGDDLDQWLLPGLPLLLQVDDPNLHEGSRRDMLAHDGRSALEVPIVFKGASIGYADLWESRRRREFTPEEIVLAQGITQQAAFAIEHARLYEQARRQAAELQQANTQQTALLAASQAISSSLDFQAVLNQLCEQIGQAINATSVYYTSWEPAVGTVTIVAEYLGPDALPLERESDLGMTYDALQSFGPLFVQSLVSGQVRQYHADDPDLPDNEREHLIAYGGQTTLDIPLIVRTGVIGLIEIWESRYRRDFTHEEIALCLGIAQQAAVAFENARLHEQVRQHAEELEKHVAERTRELQAAHDRLAAANVRLTELDQLKDEFVSRISHELRTPLTSIKIYLELLETCKPEKRTQYMTVLTEQTARLQKLIEDMLDISNLQPAATPAPLGPINLIPVIRTVCADWAKTACEKSQSLIDQSVRDLPPALGDASALMQAVAKLLSNAVNYTPRGGTITVSTGTRQVEGQTWVTVTICDTGPGITPYEMPHIFDRFYRGRAAADYKTPGTGLGLSIAQQYIRELGGRITVESEPGHGAAFTVWLKRAL